MTTCVYPQDGSGTALPFGPLKIGQLRTEIGLQLRQSRVIDTEDGRVTARVGWGA